MRRQYNLLCFFDSNVLLFNTATSTQNGRMKTPKLMTLKACSRLLLMLLTCSASAAEPASAMAERLQPCAACHGKEGHSAQQDYAPSIAGKPAEYLYQQLLNFRDGRRLNASMARMLAYLSEDYLREMAAYYAAQPANYAEHKLTPAAVNSGARGQQLFLQGDDKQTLLACATCHGEDGLGDGHAIPSLKGLPAKYMAAQLGAWQAKTRQARSPDCMATVAKRLTGDDIEAVTLWLASAPLEAAQSPRPTPRPLPLECGAVQ